MPLKGVDKFRKKLPGYGGKRIILLAILALLSFLLGLMFLVTIDVLPRLYHEISVLATIEPVLPIVGNATCAVIGYGLVHTVWQKRDDLLRESRRLAYQRGLKYGVVGIPLIMAAVVHIYLPIGQLPCLLSPVSPVNRLTLEFSSPLLSLLPPPAWTVIPGLTVVSLVQTLGSVVCLVLGLLTVRRSLVTFGMDYMGLVYLYYPEESEIQKHEIYSVLRHPTYAGILLIGFGGVLARLSVYSIAFFIMVFVGFLFHINFVEDKELIARFGRPFLRYRREVPALVIRPGKLAVYFRFILGHKKKKRLRNR